MAETTRSLMDYAPPPVSGTAAEIRTQAARRPKQSMSLMDFMSDLDLANILIGTGIPERFAAANEVLNPLAAIPRAQAASQEIFAPDRSIMQRIASTGNMLGEVGGVVVPMAASARIGAPAATALMEGLLGGSPATQAASDAARGFLADESGSLPLGKPTLDVSRRDASDIFGAGSERVRYTDPNSGGTIEVVVRPDGSASVLELEVPEAFRGRGIGQTLQARALQDFPKMGGQVSSKAAATTAYRLGRRPQGNPDATLDDVFAAIDDMSSVNMVSPAMQTAPTQTRGFLADESGSVPLPFSSTLPAPRNEAEAIAKEILELRATGNVDAVTDSMMDAADPQYMYNYTPLAMDEASRLARAREMGAIDEYHGTTSGGEMRYPSPNYGSGSRKGIGFVTSNSPYVSSSYAAPDFGGTVFPMLNRPPESGFAVVNTNGDLWSNIPSDARVVLPSGRETTVASYASVPDEHTGGYRTDYISRGAAIEGDGGVKFENIIDRGIHTPRVKDDPSVALEFQREASKPSSVMFRHDTRGMRSKFARFDPMFAHLRSLSAGVAPFGLLAFQPNEEQYR